LHHRVRVIELALHGRADELEVALVALHEPRVRGMVRVERLGLEGIELADLGEPAGVVLGCSVNQLSHSALVVHPGRSASDRDDVDLVAVVEHRLQQGRHVREVVHQARRTHPAPPRELAQAQAAVALLADGGVCDLDDLGTSGLGRQASGHAALLSSSRTAI
jgi:hypothetical protein